jgi:hypothetical protein
MSEINEKINREQEIKEAAAHQSTLLDIQQILSTKAGRSFIKYLFDSLCVAEVPPLGIQDGFLREHLGHIRAGNSVFNIVAEASPEMAGTILGQLQKEKYVKQKLDI